MAKILNKEKKKSRKSIMIKYFVRYFKILPPLVLLIILILGFSFIIGPKYSSIIEEVEKKNEEKLLSFEADGEYLNDLIKLQGTYRSINTNDIDRLNKMLPDKPEIENLMVMLENIANKQYIQFNSMNFGFEEPTGKISPVTLGKTPEQVKKIKISLDVSGVDYRGFKKLLAVLENNLRIFDINSIDFNTDGNSANLDITAYYWET